MVEQILNLMGFGHPMAVSQFKSEEDGSFYRVWRVDYSDRSYVLKQAKGQELENYRMYFSESVSYAPKLFASQNINGTDYLLMEYIQGHSMMRCNQLNLDLTLDSMVTMQEAHWGPACEEIPQGRFTRRNYLLDSRLEAAYDAYLRAFSEMPGTLCHDDLLPFNVMIEDSRAVFIDWEVGGILPYPTSLARLIAHGEEDENAVFYLKNTDRKYIIDRYFHDYVCKKRITRQEFDRHLDLCLFHEYCEWVFVGNKYSDTHSKRYRKYSKMAVDQARKLGF